MFKPAFVSILALLAFTSATSTKMQATDSSTQQVTEQSMVNEAIRESNVWFEGIPVASVRHKMYKL